MILGKREYLIQFCYRKHLCLIPAYYGVDPYIKLQYETNLTGNMNTPYST